MTGEVFFKIDGIELILEIPLQELPYEDSYLEIVTKDLQRYAEEIEKRLLMMPY